MLVSGYVRLVVDLQQHIRVPQVKQPISNARNCLHHCIFVRQSFILPEIEHSKNDNHPQLVACVDDAPSAIAIGREHLTVGSESGVIPRLRIRPGQTAPDRRVILQNATVAHHLAKRGLAVVRSRTSALQVHGDSQ